MKIRHLKIFQVVSQEESITKAASKLYISQPAVSIAIKELEESLELQLFDRIGGKIHLNNNGKLFLSKVNQLMNQYDNLVTDTKIMANSQPIIIGSSITMAYDILSNVINEFKLEYPNSIVEVIVKNARDIENMVSNNEVDLGLVEGVVLNKSFCSEVLSSYELCIFCGQEHPVRRKSNLTLNDLVTEDFLLREKGSAIRDQFDSTLRVNNLEIEPLWTSINSQVLINAAINNIGLTILPKKIVENEIALKKLFEIKIKNVSIINNNYLIYNQGKVFDDRLLYLSEIIKSQ